MNEQILPLIDQERCTLCGACIDACPSHALELGEAGPVIARPVACSYCAACEELCPNGVITLSYGIVWETSD